jgi:hypothetical protein
LKRGVLQDLPHRGWFRPPLTEARWKDALEELAKAGDRPLSNYIERVLKAHAAEEAKKQQGKRR